MVYGAAGHDASMSFYIGGSALDPVKGVTQAFAMGIDVASGTPKWRKFIGSVTNDD